MTTTARIVTWNVNGIRNIMHKTKDGKKITTKDNTAEPNSLLCLLREQVPDIVCLQEVRCNPSLSLARLQLAAMGYEEVAMNCSTIKAGYSGTAVFSKVKPLSVVTTLTGYGPKTIADKNADIHKEGRIIVAEFPGAYVASLYVPNSKPDLARLGFRTSEWEPAVRQLAKTLGKKKPVVLCGDFNVAHLDIDVHNPKTARGSHGFTDQERAAFSQLLEEASLVNTFRHLHPNTARYTWYSNFAKARERNKGWTIDYVLVSKALAPYVKHVEVLGQYYGSDHLPVVCDIAGVL